MPSGNYDYGSLFRSITLLFTVFYIISLKVGLKDPKISIDGSPHIVMPMTILKDLGRSSVV